MIPDFDKLADEALADLARGDIKGDTREILSLHGRLMYAAGIRAAADLVSGTIEELLEEAANEAETLLDDPRGRGEGPARPAGDEKREGEG